MKELKKCPFCGGVAKIFAFSDGGICVKCMTCRCQSFVSSDSTISNARNYNAYERVVDAWNRRVEE